MAILFKNNASTTLRVDHQSNVTFLVLTDDVKEVFPVIEEGSNDRYKVTLVGDNEVEIVEAWGYTQHPTYGEIVNVFRAQEGTTAQAWPAGTRVEMRITAGALNSFFNTIATTEELGVSKLSTYQQAIEGVDNTTNMTPRRTVDAIHQFNTTIVETPTVTGTTNVRSGTTYPYTFTASVVGGMDDPIVAFYYVGNQTGDEPFIRVPVTTPTSTNATATGNVSFKGNVGDVIKVTTYAETELGNVSKYGILDVKIIANNPPDISKLTHNVPTKAYAGQQVTVKFSGVTDADGDTVKYRIKSLVNCTASKTTNIAANENVTITYKWPANYPKDATNAAVTGNSTFVVEAYDFLGGTSSPKTLTTKVTYRWSNPSLSISSGTSPVVELTWGLYAVGNAAQLPGPNYADFTVTYGGETKTVASISKNDPEWSAGSITFNVPWNISYDVNVAFMDAVSEAASKVIVRNTTPVHGTSVVTFTAPVITTAQNQTITDEGTFKVAWTAGSSSPSYPVSALGIQSSTKSDFSTLTNSVPYANSTHPSITLTSKAWFQFGNPAVKNYVRVRNSWIDPVTNTYHSSAWSDPVLVVNGQTATLEPATITSPARGHEFDPSKALPITIALGAVTGQTVNQMRIVALDSTGTRELYNSGAVAYAANYNLAANVLTYNMQYQLRVDVHGTRSGWVNGNTWVPVRTIVHKFTGNPTMTFPTNGSSTVRTEAAQTYTWKLGTRVGAETDVFSRLKIVRQSDNAVVFSRDPGPNKTSVSVPANTLAHNVAYYVYIYNWFTTNGTAESSDPLKGAYSRILISTVPPGVGVIYRYSSTYTIPYNGLYRVYAFGGGGGGGGYGRVAHSGAVGFGGGGGGSGGFGWAESSFSAGTVGTFTVGAGGAGGVGSDPPTTSTSTKGTDGGAGGNSRAYFSTTGFDLVAYGGSGGEGAGNTKNDLTGDGATGGAGGAASNSNGVAGGKGGDGGWGNGDGYQGAGVNCTGGAGGKGAFNGSYLRGSGGGGGACSALNENQRFGCGGGGQGVPTVSTENGQPGWYQGDDAKPGDIRNGSPGAVIVQSMWSL